MTLGPIICFREENMSELAMKWEEHKFILGLSYLVDIFDLLNIFKSYLH